LPKLAADETNKGDIEKTRFEPRAGGAQTLACRAILMTLSWDTRYSFFAKYVAARATVQRKMVSRRL
jgi:hypothetical protein